MGLLLTLTRIIPIALGVMGAVEKMFKAIKGKGPDKKEAYIEGVMAALGVTEVTMQKDILDDEKFRKLLGDLADTTVSISNFIRDYKPREDK